MKKLRVTHQRTEIVELGYGDDQWHREGVARGESHSAQVQ